MDCVWSCLYEGWVAAPVPYSHIETPSRKDFHTDFYYFPLKIHLLYFSYAYLSSSSWVGLKIKIIFSPQA